MPGRRVVVAGLGVAVLVLAGACGRPAGTAGAAAPSSTAGPGPVTAGTPQDIPVAGEGPSPATDLRLSASVVQYRRDAQRGVLQVKVTNDGEAAVHVTHVRLDTATFTAPVEVDKDARVGAGAAVDLTVPLGEPACAGGSVPAGAHSAVLEVDGVSVELMVGPEVLVPLAVGRCAAEAVAEQVELAVAPDWVDAGQVRGEPALRGAVVVTPRPGGASARLEMAGATTLFTVAEPSAVDVPAGSTAPVPLDVLLTVTRCDPHAVAEDKKGYLLPVRVSLGGAAEVVVEVAVPVPERAPLQDLIDRTCGFG